jgi:hypothetical protein
MPGAIRVTLRAGETAFYNSNILHCATYHPNARRETLHACVGDIRGGTSRARNILQHGLKWMEGEQFRETLDEKGKRMLDNLIRMRGQVGERDVGYSQA